MEAKVAPSLLSADFGNLARDVEVVNNSSADYIHVDIMDGVFVPNISIGFPVMSAIKKAARKPLDVHLMISNPDAYIDRFCEAGADILTVHYEACTHLHRTIEHIKCFGKKVGVAINPHTPVEVLTDILADIDLVLVMTVNPGFGGQSFIEHSYNKLDRLQEMIEKQGVDVMVEVDGGVSLKNAAKLVEHGVDVLVAGNSVFGCVNPTEAIENLKNLNDGTK